MNLHRTTGQADWVEVSLENRNNWQKLASRTHGVVTPANVATLLGLAMTAAGIYQLFNGELLLAAGLMLVGRLLDVADGWLAESTGTKSPLGEVLDASVDKLVTIGVVVALMVLQLVPIWLLAALIGLQLVIAMVVAYQRHRGVKTHSTRTGKYSMLAVWIGLIGLVAATATSGWLSSTLEAVSYAAAIVSIGLSLVALYQYATMD